MINQLREPPAGFEDVVRQHFHLLGDEILEQCFRWARAAHARAAALPGEYDWGVDIATQALILKAEIAKLRQEMA